MNYSLAVFLINKNVRAVFATYEDNQNPTIFKTLDQTIKKDDICVVPSTTRHGFTTVKIVETDVDVDFDSPKLVSWIVGPVELDEYKQTIDQETKAIQVVKSAELRKKREDLAAAMFKDHTETLKTLEISTMAEAPTTDAPKI